MICYRLFGPRFTGRVKRLLEVRAGRTGGAVVCGWQATMQIL
jgi:hypothetical protein